MEGGLSMAVWNTINYTDIRPDRFDAEFFEPLYRENIKVLTSGQSSRLGDLFAIVNRGEKAEYRPSGDIPVLRSVNIRELSFNDQRQEYVSNEYYNKRSRGQVHKGDILITSTGTGTLGRTSIWYKETPAFNVPENSFLRGPIGVNPYFVAAYLSTKYGTLQLFQNQRGSSGQLHLYPVDIKRVVIPNFLFAYQEEIGKYLTKAFDLEEQSQSLYHQAEELLAKELKLDKLTLSQKKWYTADFSELIASKRIDSSHYKNVYTNMYDFIHEHFTCKKIKQIVSVNRRGVQPIYSPQGDIIVVNSKHLSSTHIRYDLTERTTSKEYVLQPQAQIKNGDVLIYTTGAYVGLTNAFNSQEAALASNHVNILRLSDETIDPNYLALVLNSVIGKLQTEKYSRGSAQLELYPFDIDEFVIPIIDEGKMKEIGTLVRESLISLNQSKELLAKAKNRVEELIEQEAGK